MVVVLLAKIKNRLEQTPISGNMNSKLRIEHDIFSPTSNSSKVPVKRAKIERMEAQSIL